MSEILHSALVENGTYTKSYEEFKNQFSTANTQNLLYKALNGSGDYTKSKKEFKSQFFTTVQEDFEDEGIVEGEETPETEYVEIDNTIDEDGNEVGVKNELIRRGTYEPFQDPDSPNLIDGDLAISGYDSSTQKYEVRQDALGDGDWSFPKYIHHDLLYPNGGGSQHVIDLMESKKEMKAEDARVAEDKKNALASFNALSPEAKNAEAEEAGFKNSFEYKQSLMGAKVTTKNTIGGVTHHVSSEDEVDSTTVDDFVTKGNEKVVTGAMTTEEKAAEHDARNNPENPLYQDFETWLKEKNEGVLKSKSQAVKEGVNATGPAISDFLGFVWDAGKYTVTGKVPTEDYDPLGAVKEQSNTYYEGQKDLYKLYQNEYKTSDDTSDVTTMQGFFKTQLEDGKVYNPATNQRIDADLEAKEEEGFTYGVNNAAMEISGVAKEYNRLRNKAIFDMDKEGVKKYFGRDLDEFNKENPDGDAYSLSNWLGFDENLEKPGKEEKEMADYDQKQEGGLDKKDLNTIFGEGNVGAKDDFRNWFHNNSKLAAQMELMYKPHLLTQILMSMKEIVLGPKF